MNTTVIQPLRQVESPCPVCSSYYVRGTKCNLCNMERPIGPVVQEEMFSRKGKPPRGALWDKKQHRVIPR